MYNIIFKTYPTNGIGSIGLGLCSYNEPCPEPIELTDVNGTITITDGENKLTLNILNDVISIPILIDDDIKGKTHITIQEVNKQSGQNSGSSNSLGIGIFGTSNPTQTKKQEDKKEINPFAFGGFGTQPFEKKELWSFDSRDLVTNSFNTFGSFGIGSSNSTQIKKPIERFYQLSIGKLFKTKFYVKNNEFHAMAKEMDDHGSYNGNPGNRNVIEMNISFKIENGLQLISKK